MSLLVILLLVAIFVFPDTVIISPVLSVPRIITILIILKLFFSLLKSKTGYDNLTIQESNEIPTKKAETNIILKLYTAVISFIILFGEEYRINLKTPFRELIITWLLLIIYIFVIDIFHNEFTQAVNDFVINSMFLLLFLSLFSLQLKPNFYSKVLNKTILFLSFVIVLFGILQIFYPQITLDNLFGSNPVINQNTNQLIKNYVEREGRITGPFNISIGYSILLGFILIYFLICYKYDRKYSYLLILSISSIAAIFTFTRSLLYGILPSIMFGNYIMMRNKKKLLKDFTYVAVGSLLLYITVLKIIENKDERVTSFLDPGTGAKIVANYYGMLGAIKQNPIFGVPFEKNIEVISAGIDMEADATINSNLILDTNHNQFIWFLKYYGSIGLILFIIFNIKLYKNIIMINDNKYMSIILIFYIYFLQFSLLHNNFLFRDYYFITFLGLVLNKENV